MKIAAVTDDGQALSAHFGRARHFLVVTEVNGEIMDSVLLDKVIHEGHGHHHEGHGRHEHHDDSGQGTGHGTGGHRHDDMIAPIFGSDVLLARGMGQGAFAALKAAGIKPITTEIQNIDEAIKAYLQGLLIDRPERRH